MNENITSRQASIIFKFKNKNHTFKEEKFGITVSSFMNVTSS